MFGFRKQFRELFNRDIQDRQDRDIDWICGGGLKYIFVLFCFMFVLVLNAQEGFSVSDSLMKADSLKEMSSNLDSLHLNQSKNEDSNSGVMNYLLNQFTGFFRSQKEYSKEEYQLSHSNRSNKRDTYTTVFKTDRHFTSVVVTDALKDTLSYKQANSGDHYNGSTNYLFKFFFGFMSAVHSTRGCLGFKSTFDPNSTVSDVPDTLTDYEKGYRDGEYSIGKSNYFIKGFVTGFLVTTTVCVFATSAKDLNTVSSTMMLGIPLNFLISFVYPISGSKPDYIPTAVHAATYRYGYEASSKKTNRNSYLLGSNLLGMPLGAGLGYLLFLGRAMTTYPNDSEEKFENRKEGWKENHWIE